MDPLLDDIEELSADVSANHARVSASSVRRATVRRTGGRASSTATSAPTFSEHIALIDQDDENEVTRENEITENDASTATFEPGKAVIFVKTWGCSHNNSDSEYMAGILAAHGYTIVTDDNLGKDAHLWLLNSCTVKNPSEQAFVHAITRAKQMGKKIVLAGCVPQGQPNRASLDRPRASTATTAGSADTWDGLSVIGVQQIEHVVWVVEETLQGNTVRLTDMLRNDDGSRRPAAGARLALPKVRRNAFVEIIPINTGCLNQCTYCKTKHARGDLASYPVQEIVDRVRSVTHDEGVVEVWLTSEDTGTYGRDIGSSLPQLLEAIIPVVPPWCMVRVGMTNPPYILEHLDAIAKLLAHPRMYAFLHVPVQSGSDRVLDDMRRQYTRTEFDCVANTLTAAGVNVATDVICGFPTESDEDFADTLALLDHHQFGAVHISQFYARPGTPAARMPPLPSTVIKARSRAATALFESYAPHEREVGNTYRVLVTDVAADKRHYVAHNKRYVQVLVPMVQGYLGHWVDVEVVAATKYSVLAKVVGEAPVSRVTLAAEVGWRVDDAGSSHEDDGPEMVMASRGARASSSAVTAGSTTARRRVAAAAFSSSRSTAATGSKKVIDDLPTPDAILAAHGSPVSPAMRRVAAAALAVGCAALAYAVAVDDLVLAVPALVLAIGAVAYSMRTTSVPVTEWKARVGAEMEAEMERRRHR